MCQPARVGTLSWTRQTGGLLRGRDRWTLLGQACLYGLATLPAEVRRVLGIRRRNLARIDPAQLEPPDSRAGREAERLLAEAVPPVVATHAHRTYAWGAALAACEGISFDNEVVYVASLLHDLHFADPTALPEPHCFTLPAAEKALELGAEAGWDDARATAAAEAVTLHLNLWPPNESNEARVVFLGARLDVVGYRYWDLHRETVRDVLERHPRLELKREFAPMVEAQAVTNPGSRVHFYTRYLAGNWFVRRTPFDE
jgi:hypothetical protein